VSTGEAAEVMAINTLAPFIINGRLRHLMESSKPLPIHFAKISETSSSSSSTSSQKEKKIPKFIVNVSAMEGKFYRFKTANHPHTNMAKVILSMFVPHGKSPHIRTFALLSFKLTSSHFAHKSNTSTLSAYKNQIYRLPST
jgi:hypothetical protein